LAHLAYAFVQFSEEPECLTAVPKSIGSSHLQQNFSKGLAAGNTQTLFIKSIHTM